MLVNQQQQKSPVFIPHQNGVARRDEKQMKEKGKSRIWEGDAQRSQHDW